MFLLTNQVSLNRFFSVLFETLVVANQVALTKCENKMQCVNLRAKLRSPVGAPNFQIQWQPKILEVVEEPFTNPNSSKVIIISTESAPCVAINVRTLPT